jgi:hypothetical protein
MTDRAPEPPLFHVYKPGDVCMIGGAGIHCGKVIVLTNPVFGTRSGWPSWQYMGRKLQAGDGFEVSDFFEHCLIPLEDWPGVDEVNLVRMVKKGSDHAAKVLADRKETRRLKAPRRPLLLRAESNNSGDKS